MDYIEHSKKGTTWKNHKYIRIENGRYIYSESKGDGKGGLSYGKGDSGDRDATADEIHSLLKGFKLAGKGGSKKKSSSSKSGKEKTEKEKKSSSKEKSEKTSSAKSSGGSLKEQSEKVQTAPNEGEKKLLTVDEKFNKVLEDYKTKKDSDKNLQQIRKAQADMEKKKKFKHYYALPERVYLDSDKPSLDEIYHHGVLGQKWGKKNGPPYPLDASDHSASERKAGYEKSINGSGHNEEDYAYPTKKTKKKQSLVSKMAASNAKYWNNSKKKPKTKKRSEDDDAEEKAKRARESVRKAKEQLAKDLDDPTSPEFWKGSNIVSDIFAKQLANTWAKSENKRKQKAATPVQKSKKDDKGLIEKMAASNAKYWNNSKKKPKTKKRSEDDDAEEKAKRAATPVQKSKKDDKGFIEKMAASNAKYWNNSKKKRR